MTSEQFVTRLAVTFFSVMCATLIIVIAYLRHQATKQGSAKNTTSETANK